VVTLGDDGALWLAGGGDAVHVPGVAVDVVDTTAAGDTFNAALGVGLAEGMPVTAALRFANAAAALACTRRGAQPSLPRRDEVTRFTEGRRPPVP
jgi:ribokinase